MLHLALFQHPAMNNVFELSNTELSHLTVLNAEVCDGKHLCFLHLFCSPRLHLFDDEYSKNGNIAKYYYYLKITVVIYSCDQSWIFSIVTPVFSVTWYFRNNSNMLIWKHFFLLSMIKTAMLLNILVETMIHFLGFIWWSEIQKNSIYMKA